MMLKDRDEAFVTHVFKPRILTCRDYRSAPMFQPL